jgi:hypothetical protein
MIMSPIFLPLERSDAESVAQLASKSEVGSDAASFANTELKGWFSRP